MHRQTEELLQSLKASSSSLVGSQVGKEGIRGRFGRRSNQVTPREDDGADAKNSVSGNG